MENWLEDIFGESIEFVIISDDDSDIHETFAGNLVNAKTDIRKINTEAEKLNFLFLNAKEEDLNHQSNETPVVVCEDTVSQTQAENSTSTVSIFSENDHSYINSRKSQLRPRFRSNSLICLECGKQFKSISRKEKHVSLSEKCRNSIDYKQIISCLCCKIEFSCEENKLKHLRTSINCQNLLKDNFFDCQFLDSARICNNYSLTKYMCPFCTFTADNGDVFDHVLNALRCRKSLEDAILKYNNEVKCSSIHFSEDKQKQQQHKEKQHQPQFSCNICSRIFASSRSLKTHRVKKHHEVTKSKKRNRKCGPNDLYCFICRKFLKSPAEAEAHPCEPTRLLSRSCYKRAVWREGEYECLSCREKFFHARNVLEKHMHTHEEKKSPLFQFLPLFSKQDKIPSVHFSGVADESVRTASKLHHMDIGGEAKNWNLNVEERRFSKNMLIEKKDFACEKCSKIFDFSDVFIAHVLMSSPCLEHYQNSENRPDNLCYCFRCKSRLEEACKEHYCIGLVVQLFQCAVCPWISPNLTNLRNHEMIHHQRFLHSSKLKYKQVLSVTDGNVGETTDYHCTPCQKVFRNLSEFLKHISNPH